MRRVLFSLLALACAAPVSATPGERPARDSASTAGAAAAVDGEQQPLVQESDEDLTDFVTDYIRKDIQLKGAFFFEDKTSGKVLRLRLSAVEPKIRPGTDGTSAVTARFGDAAGAKHTLVFWVRDGAWGGLDISRIELERSPGKPGVKD